MNDSPLANVALMYVILIGVNLPTPFLGLDSEPGAPPKRLRFEPPGFVIPIVWLVLFTGLGVARALVVRSGGTGAGLVVVLALVCAAYAYYTLGLAKLTGVSALWFGLFGNVVVIVLALAVASEVYIASPTASGLVVPVAVWTAFATAIVIGQMRVRRLL